MWRLRLTPTPQSYHKRNMGEVTNTAVVSGFYFLSLCYPFSFSHRAKTDVVKLCLTQLLLSLMFIQKVHSATWTGQLQLLIGLV
jgi:hypothetical protein